MLPPVVGQDPGREGADEVLAHHCCAGQQAGGALEVQPGRDPRGPRRQDGAGPRGRPAARHAALRGRLPVPARLRAAREDGGRLRPEGEGVADAGERRRPLGHWSQQEAHCVLPLHEGGQRGPPRAGRRAAPAAELLGLREPGRHGGLRLERGRPRLQDHRQRGGGAGAPRAAAGREPGRPLGHQPRLHGGVRLEVHVLRPHAGGDADVRRGRHKRVGLPLPQAPGPRRGAADDQGHAAAALHGPEPAAAEPLPGLRRAEGAPEPAVPHPGPAGDRQDGHQRDDRLPPHAAEPGPGAGLRALEHRGGPAGREAAQDGPEGRAPERQEPGGRGEQRGLPDAAPPGPPPGHAGPPGAPEAARAQGGAGRALARRREEVQAAAELHRARAAPGRRRHLHDLRRRRRPAPGELPLQAGAVRRVDAVYGARMHGPHHDGCEADRPRRRPLPARAGHHVQEGREGGVAPEPLRAPHLPAAEARATRGAVPHAPMPLGVPLAVLLRRLPPERRDPQRAPLRRDRLPLAAPGHAHVLLQLHGR
mmetsp:Transcript_79860/g.209697  ORF Transcript_79860/g.209697 Transcript_79860/m.209697 type:complete len:535 (-) Transcript_79860:391-1995(-)